MFKHRGKETRKNQPAVLPLFASIRTDEVINYFSEYLQREEEFSVSSDDNFLLLNGFLVDLCMCWLSSPSICIRFHWLLRSFLMQLSFLLGTYHLYSVVLKGVCRIRDMRPFIRIISESASIFYARHCCESRLMHPFSVYSPSLPDIFISLAFLSASSQVEVIFYIFSQRNEERSFSRDASTDNAT